MQKWGWRIVVMFCAVAAATSLRITAAPPPAPMLGGDEPSTPTMVLHGNAAGKGAKGDVYTMAFSPDGQTIATGSSDGKVRVWNATTGKWAGNLDTGGLYRVTSVGFTPDGKSLVAADVQNAVYIWDMASKALTATLTPAQAGDFAHLQVCMAVAPPPPPSPAKAAATRPARAATTRPATTRAATTAPASADSVHGIATGAEDGVLHIFDAVKKKETATLKTDSDIIWDIAYSPDGKTLATAEGNQPQPHKSDIARSVGEIVLRDPATGAMRLAIPCETPIKSIAFSSDGKLIASNGKDVTLWNVATAQQFATVPQRYHCVSVAFSHNGTLGASGDVDTTVRVWKTDGTIEGVFKLAGRIGDVGQVSFSPDDKIVASVVRSDVMLWDVSTLLPPPPATQPATRKATTQKSGR